MKLGEHLCWCFGSLLLPAVWSVALDLKGPQFRVEPVQQAIFTNTSGMRVDCAAHGSPPPVIEWIIGDGAPVNPVQDLRLIYANGSLVFLPFSPDRYRDDVHNAFYRCRARNQVGQILSRRVRVRAVVLQQFEIQVYDEYVISGNTAVLKCHVPTYVSEFVMVTAWIQDDNINIYPNIDTGGKHSVLTSGELFIYNAGPSDGYKSYSCRTVHKLTGTVQKSSYPGRIIITEPKGNVQPRITVDKHLVRRVSQGGETVLPCVAQGYPIPTYRWFREDRDQLLPVHTGGDRVRMMGAGLLKISKVRLEDGGKYICWVNNSIGEETVQVTVTVTAPLAVLIQPQSQMVDVGKEAIFQCIPTGFPVSRVTWYHNGKTVTRDSRFDVSTSPEKLMVRPLQKEDHGMYQCIANNDWDMAQGTAELLLGDASPELLYWFTEQTLQPGPAVSLKCVATGNPPPQFTWTLDGFPIPDNPRFLVGQYVTIHDDVISHVNITHIREEDGGEYTCTAKNSVSAVAHSARINVYGLPFIREMPKINAVSGRDLVIKCPVAGYPIESVTWERDGTILPINRRQRVYPNGTLVIEHAQRPTDVGTYTCQAQNRQKHTARREVEVQVLVPPKILPIQSMANLLREGMRAAITCSVLEGDMPIHFQWERNGHTLPIPGLSAATKRMDEYSSSLILESITSKHTGNYTCIAQNVAGSESFTVPVTVNVQPHWTVESSDTSMAAGQDVTLHCQADGYPIPSITWRKAVGTHPGEYKEFMYEPNVNFYRNGSIEFLHISKESEGHYLCEAKNGVGPGISKVIFLKVNAPAHFQHKSKQIQVQRGDQAHLQCTALGDTPIDILWKNNGKHITEDTDQRYSIREQVLDDGMVSELTISYTYRHDTGVLTCHGSNAYGQDEMTIQLIVQEVPEMPKNIRVNDQQSRSLQLTWTQPFAGNSPITSYIIQYKLVGDIWQAQPSKVAVPGSQTTATIQNLSPASSYHFRIMAENALGISDPSEAIQVTTNEEVPSGPPQDVRAEAKSSTELFVAWEPPLRELWNGNLLGYYVGYQEQTTHSALLTASPSTTMMNYSFRTVEIGTHYGGDVTLENLAKYATYVIVVQAYNSRGPGPLSEPISAKTMEDVPNMPPESVQCSSLTSQSLEVSWEPPPPESCNGIVQGYKVSYMAAEGWFETDEQETKVTPSLRTTIPSLRKYTNYSISVLAYTNMGDGVKSAPIFCRTEEDVPSPPADIKAVMSSGNKILVSWLPPLHPNGQLIGYNFYMGLIEDGKEEGTPKRFLNPSTEMHETDRLQDKATYQFWVTASTKIGEGDSTRVVTISPSNKVPAKIVSFSREIISPWKEDLLLPCRKVGIPSPQVTWRLHEKILESNGRKQINKDGSLQLMDIQHSDDGNYTCSIENIHGKDEIIYSIKVLVPPDAPLLTVIASYPDSLQLQWSDNFSGGSPILGYVINYKREHGNWKELQIESQIHSHLLHNLWCGTRYQLYITAFNKIGTGLPCDIVNAYTKGTVPVKPKSSQLLTVNSTVVTVWLDAWGDGGCPILYFIIEYHQTTRTEWMLVANNVLPSERVYSITELIPATKYNLRVTAHNNAGAAVAHYNFTTLTAEGVTVIPEMAPPLARPRDVPFYANMKMIIPVVTSVVLIINLVAVGLFIRRRRLQKQAAQMGESPSVAQMQNEQNRDQQYLAVRVTSGQHQGQCTESGNCKTDNTDYKEDICPYATFQLAKPPYSESTYSGNVYSGPYHSVRGSFVYHDPKSSGADSYKFRHQQKEPEYTKVRRKGGKLRDPHSESQESDNLGSTDSEVKKILTLHLPISEYDTLGSDSEGDTQGTTMTASQELVSFRQHRMPRNVRKSGESSSSSETSPSGARKPYPSRKSKTKNQMVGKRHVRSSSGYSSHTEETTFSFSDRIHPPSLFSDSHSRELSEAECDMRLARKSGRSSAPTRLSRETSFQIDV